MTAAVIQVHPSTQLVCMWARRQLARRAGGASGRPCCDSLMLTAADEQFLR